MYFCIRWFRFECYIFMGFQGFCCYLYSCEYFIFLKARFPLKEIILLLLQLLFWTCDFAMGILKYYLKSLTINYFMHKLLTCCFFCRLLSCNRNFLLSCYLLLLLCWKWLIWRTFTWWTNCELNCEYFTPICDFLTIELP